MVKYDSNWRWAWAWPTFLWGVTCPDPEMQVQLGIYPSWREGGLLRVKIIQQETNNSPPKCKCLPSRQGQDHYLWALEICPRFLPRKHTASAGDRFLTADIPLPWPSLHPLGGESHGVRVGVFSHRICPCPLWDSAATATASLGFQLLRVAVTAESLWCPSDAEAENTLRTLVLCSAGLSCYPVSSS